MGHSSAHICQCLSRILAARGDAPVAISAVHGRTRTGGEFVSGVLGLANGLRELGVGEGDVVCIAALNSEWYMEWLLAVTFLGGIVAPLNYRWNLEEARVAVELVKPTVIVVDESCREWASQIQFCSIRFHVLVGESPCILAGNSSVTHNGSIRKQPNKHLNFCYSWAPKDIAFICFTSGTTGKPKGVSINHVSLIIQALAKIAVVGYNEDDVYLHTAPLCHIGGISSCIAVLLAGGCHVFLPKFAAETAILAIKEYNATSLITVPTMLADLVSYIRERGTRNIGESVKRILNGGGSLSIELVNAATNIFPHAKLLSAYGMTEACSSLSFVTLHDPSSTSSWMAPKYHLIDDSSHSQLGGMCVGRPPIHIELQIKNTDSGDSERTLKVGRILTRGAHVMVGYWDQIAATELAFTPDGWLDTGDTGWIDSSGCLWLLGRTKDRIKSGGENIDPGEVETVLLQHPGVSSCVVIGIPDFRLSEMVVACVCLRENWKWVDEKKAGSLDAKEISGKALQIHCRERNLSRFKLPKRFIWWKKPFPLTPTGKLKREEVKSEATTHLQFLISNL